MNPRPAGSAQHHQDAAIHVCPASTDQGLGGWQRPRQTVPRADTASELLSSSASSRGYPQVQLGQQELEGAGSKTGRASAPPEPPVSPPISVTGQRGGTRAGSTWGALQR